MHINFSFCCKLQFYELMKCEKVSTIDKVTSECFHRNAARKRSRMAHTGCALDKVQNGSEGHHGFLTLMIHFNVNVSFSSQMKFLKISIISGKILLFVLKPTDIIVSLDSLLPFESLHVNS